MEDWLVPTAFFTAVSVIFSLWFYFRYKARIATQKTFRLALEKGTELSPEFIKQLGEPERSRDKDLRLGLIWVAIGLAMLILGAAINEPDALGPIMGSSAFPGLIGVAYLVMWRYGSTKD